MLVLFFYFNLTDNNLFSETKNIYHLDSLSNIKNSDLDEMHEITNNHSAVLYVADLYEEMMNIIQEVYPPNFVEVIKTSFTNAGDENFDEFYPKLVDSMIASASDPYDPLLGTALDCMKKVSEMFNIFHKPILFLRPAATAHKRKHHN